MNARKSLYQAGTISEAFLLDVETVRKGLSGTNAMRYAQNALGHLIQFHLDDFLLQVGAAILLEPFYDRHA